MTRSGLLRASLTLLAGGALSQVIPLALAPLLTRLAAPAEFGLYHTFAAVAANVAVVACARFEFALPLARDDDEARAITRLALAILTAVSLVALAAGLLWAWLAGAAWPLALPLAVAGLGLLSLAGLRATREQRFSALARSRVVHQGGGAVMQLLLLWLQWGTMGLIAGPICAAWAAAAVAGGVPARAAFAERAQVLEAARRHRDFPLLNTPHAFLGALQDTLAIALVAAWAGPAAAGSWGLCMRILKAPATLVGGAVSQPLYAQLSEQVGTDGNGSGCASASARASVVRVMALLGLLAAPGVMLLLWGGPALFVWAFGAAWHDAGMLAAALALYIGVHFVASPLGVVTMAWQAQGFALRIAVVGQVIFLVALCAGLAWGGLVAAGWAVSVAMSGFFAVYFWRLARWPVTMPRTERA